MAWGRNVDGEDGHGLSAGCERGRVKVRVVLPCCNEKHALEATLEAIFRSALKSRSTVETEIVVVANGCTDGSAGTVHRWRDSRAAPGVAVRVIEMRERCKTGALTAGWPADYDGIGIAFDADVIVSAGFIGDVARALTDPAPRYATGRLEIAPLRSWWSRAYARVWSRMPYAIDGSPGCGAYATNGAGRRRWGAFPKIVADDLFVRHHFSRTERVRVAAPYVWPMPDGLRNLVRARWRWSAGNAQLDRLYPRLRHDGSASRGRGRMLRNLSLSSWEIAVFLFVQVLGGALAAMTARQTAKTWRRAR